MRKLFLIPARGGSKGLPRKNILPLAGRPMIHYTLDAAIGAAEEADVICVSTEDAEIKRIVEAYGLEVPFVRPAELAIDRASTQQVIDHALQWYADRGQHFDLLVLLQVTSPLRNAQHIREALALWRPDLDMVVSVKETDANPYFTLVEENEAGFLRPSKKGEFGRRQDCPRVWQYNGAIYVMNMDSLKKTPFAQFDRVVKYPMPPEASVDVDSMLDLQLVELLLCEDAKSQETP